MIGAGFPEPPMPLGESLKGTDVEGNLINEEKLGQVYVFPASRVSNTIRGSKGRFTGKPIVAVLMRNTSGGVLLGKRLGQLDRTAGYTMTKEVNGYSTGLGNGPVVLIDPYLPSAGVADDDIFWGIVHGPALVLLPLTSSGHADIAVNDPLVAHTGTTTGATTSGRVTKVQFANATAGETGAGLQAFTMAYNVIGRAMSARTSQETTAGADILVDFAIRHW
jgi:hypothetical protein